MDRRHFIGTLAAGVACTQLPRLLGSEPLPKDYRRANTDWLAKCRYGVGVHWTAQTVPRTGPALPFQKAVETFNVKQFIMCYCSQFGGFQELCLLSQNFIKWENVNMRVNGYKDVTEQQTEQNITIFNLEYSNSYQLT